MSKEVRMRLWLAAGALVTAVALWCNCARAQGYVAGPNACAGASGLGTHSLCYDTGTGQLSGVGSAPALSILLSTGTNCSAGLFADGIGAALAPACAQVLFSNLGGSATAAQMPAFTGDTTTSAGSTVTTTNTVEGGKTPVVTIGANTASGTATAAALNGFNLSGVIDVTNPKYGAKCDGVTDDTIALNAAVSVGGVIKFPPGRRCLVSGLITVSSNSILNLNGASIFASPNTALTGGILDLVSVSNVWIVNGTIDPAYTTGIVVSVAIVIQNSQHIHISSVTIGASGLDGIIVDNGSQDVHIDKCAFLWTTVSGANPGDGVHVGDNSGATPIKDVWVEHSQFSGFFDDAVGLTNSTSSALGYDVGWIHVDHNFINLGTNTGATAAANTCIDIAGVHDVWFSENDCSGYYGDAAVQIHRWPENSGFNEAYNVHIESNSIHDPSSLGANSRAAVDFTDVGGTSAANENHPNNWDVILGNMIDAGSQSGVFPGGQNILILGNTFRSAATGDGIQLAYPSASFPANNIIIAHNTFTGSFYGISTNNNTNLGVLRIFDNFFYSMGIGPMDNTSLSGEAVSGYGVFGNSMFGLAGGPISLTMPSGTLTGTPTAGAASCSQSMQGTLKIATCYLNAYQETGTAQTFTFPTAFSTAPGLLASCGTYNPSVNPAGTILTLPANAAMTAETCNVTAIGQ